MKTKSWQVRLKIKAAEDLALIRKLYDRCEELEGRALSAEIECDSMRRLVEMKRAENKMLEEARHIHQQFQEMSERLESLNAENRMLYRRIYEMEPPEGK